MTHNPQPLHIDAEAGAQVQVEALLVRIAVVE
jgi:acyl dehydratase